MIKKFTITINTTHSVAKVLHELELAVNELVEKDEDVIEIKYEKTSKPRKKTRHNL